MPKFQNVIDSLIESLNDPRPFTVCINNRILLALIHQVSLVTHAEGNRSAYAHWAREALAELGQLRFGGLSVGTLIHHLARRDFPFALPEPILADAADKVGTYPVSPGVRLERKQTEVKVPHNPQPFTPAGPAPVVCPFEPGCPFRSPPSPHKPCHCPTPLTP